MAVDEAKRRIFQDRIIQAATAAISNQLDLMVVAPTGAGKTHIAIETIKNLQFAHNGAFRTLVVQDRVAVAEQNKSAADRALLSGNALWIDGVAQSSGRTVFSSIDTALKPDAKLDNFDLVLIDEAHHSRGEATQGVGTEYSRLIDRMTAANPHLTVMGLSATEHRSDGVALHPRLHRAQRLRVTHHEAFDAGAIVPPHTILPNLRLEGRGGTTIEEAIQPFFRSADPSERDAGIMAMLRQRRGPDFLEAVVQKTLAHAPDIPGFAYVSRIKDANLLAQLYRTQGVAAEAIHYGIPATRNRETIAAFDRGDLNMLVSVAMLTEGINTPRAGLVVNAKEITTFNDMMQMNGRAMRAYTFYNGTQVTDKYKAINLDFGATTYVHGKPEVAMAIETLAHHGRAATNTRLWKRVSTSPSVLAMSRGTTTLFAVQQPSTNEPNRAYALFVQDDLAKRRSPTQFLLSRSDPAWSSSAGLEAYERSEANSRPRYYQLAESLPSRGPVASAETAQPSRLDEMAHTAFTAGRDALRLMSTHSEPSHSPARTPARSGREIA